MVILMGLISSRRDRETRFQVVNQLVRKKENHSDVMLRCPCSSIIVLISVYIVRQNLNITNSINN